MNITTRLEIMGSLVALLPPEGVEPSFDYLETVREAAKEIERQRAEIRTLHECGIAKCEEIERLKNAALDCMFTAEPKIQRDL